MTRKSLPTRPLGAKCTSTRNNSSRAHRTSPQSRLEEPSVDGLFACLFVLAWWLSARPQCQWVSVAPHPCTVSDHSANLRRTDEHDGIEYGGFTATRLN